MNESESVARTTFGAEGGFKGFEVTALADLAAHLGKCPFSILLELINKCLKSPRLPD